MHDDFDPYFQWLGIPSHERPVHHYRLLGLVPFEPDVAAIEKAADQRMVLIRGFQTGPRGAQSQKLLNELATARHCLLNPATKASYDAALQGMLAAQPRTATAYFPGQAATANGSAPAPRAVLVTGNRAASAVPLARPTAGPVAMSPPVVPLTGIAIASPPVTPPPVTSPLIAAPHSHSEHGNERTFPWLLVVGIVLGIAALAGVVMWQSKMKSDDVVSDESGKTQSSEMNSTPTPDDPEPPPAAVVIAQEGNGDVNFPLSVATIHGETLQLEINGDEYQLGQWTSDADWLSWQFHVTKPGIFHLEIIYATSEDNAGTQLQVNIEEQEKIIELRTSPSPDEFITDTNFIAIPRSGEHVLELRAKQKQGTEVCRLKTLRLRPHGT